MTSETNVVRRELQQKAQIIGREIAKRGHVLITGGGTTGVSFFVAESAKLNGGRVIAICPGFSSAKFRHDHLRNKDIFDAVIQTGLSSSETEENSIGSDYLNVVSSDGIIFIDGNAGTLAEFIIAVKAEKMIGVLTNSGGMSEFFDKIVSGHSQNNIIRRSDPRVLVKDFLDLLDRGSPGLPGDDKAR
jgi:uncharacterized protein (TIGR00725 family)